MTSVGLVLGAGGIAGFAYHAAVLSALQRFTKWDPRTADLIVGTSAGANVGALLRGDVAISDALDRILTVPTNPRSMARLRELSGREQSALSARPALRYAPSSLRLAARELMRGPFLRPSRVLAGLLPAGRIRTDAIGDRAAELHQGVWPEKGLWLAAVRLSDGERVVFGRDRTDIGVGTASEASSAIPGFFRPVHIDGDRYVDGGIHSASNADLMLDQRMDIVVIVSPMSGTPTKALPRALNGSIRLISKRNLRRETEQLEQQGTVVLVIEPTIDEIRAMGPTMMDPSRVVNTVLQTSSAVRVALAHSEMAEKLDLLRRAADNNPSPRDVAYPD